MINQPLKDYSASIIVYKLIVGLIELILGISILLYGRKLINYYELYRMKELIEDPHDLLISVTDKVVAPIVIHHRFYLLFYLLVFGVAKIIGAVGMYYKKAWGTDILIVLFLILLPFDLYALFYHPTFYKSLFVSLNFLIALYLMRFKPHKHLARLKRYLK